MKEQKKPWSDVPIEVLIEQERLKRLKKQEEDRPRISIQAPTFIPRPLEEQPQTENEYLIDFLL